MHSRIKLWVVLVLLLVAVGLVAAVAAQDGAGQNPNDVLEPPGEPGTTLADEDMAGRSPNDVLQPAQDDASSAPQDVAPAAVAANGRRFLVTLANVTGSQALDACPAGFHMASLYELHDVTALAYAADQPDVKIQADQGNGPPVGWWGWARTGNAASTTNTAGLANCGTWTSTQAGEYGTIVRLAASWTVGATAISPWQAQTWSCAGLAPVWCVED